MTRRTFWAILAAPAVVFAWLCLLDPALFLWGLAVAAALVVVGAVGAAVVVGREVVDLRTNLADANERAEVLADALAAADVVAVELTIARDLWKQRHEALLSKRGGPSGPKPHLRVVPTQRVPEVRSDAWLEEIVTAHEDAWKGNTNEGDAS